LPFLPYDTADEFLYLSELMTANTQVSEDNCNEYNEAREHQETARKLMHQGLRADAARRAVQACESARKAYGDK
jgi:hypothetical protein